MGRPALALCAGLLVLLAVVFLPRAAAASPAEGAPGRWDLDDVAQEGQLTVYHAAAGGTIMGMPLAAGDLDGDGRDEAIYAPFTREEGRGAVVVVFGRLALRGSLDLAADPSPAVTLRGGAPGHNLGCEVAAGDVTGDGIADLIIGVPGADGPGGARVATGQVRIIPGGAAFRAALGLEDAGAQSIIIHGASAGDHLGCWVASSDLDGDGTRDLILSASDGDGPDGGRPDAGTLFVLFGGRHLRGDIDLAAPGELPLVALYGMQPGDHFGAQAAAGDFDGDGRADLLVGVAQAFVPAGVGGADGPDGQRPDAGGAVIIYGEVLQPGARIDVGALPQEQRTLFHGAAEGHHLGEDVAAGDFNGDGISDAALGAIFGNRSYLVYGRPSLRGATIDLRDPPPGVVLFHAEGGAVGDTNQFADVNGDGLADLLLGAPEVVPLSAGGGASLFIFFGTPEPLAAEVNLQGPLEPYAVGIVHGSTAEIAYGVTSGDINGDGRSDVVVNGLGGAGPRGDLPRSGSGYVLDGRLLTQRFFGAPPTLTISPASGFPALNAGPRAFPAALESAAPGEAGAGLAEAGGGPARFTLVITALREEPLLPRDAASFILRLNRRVFGVSLIGNAVAAGAATLEVEPGRVRLTFPDLPFPPLPLALPFTLAVHVAGAGASVLYGGGGSEGGEAEVTADPPAVSGERRSFAGGVGEDGSP